MPKSTLSALRRGLLWLWSRNRSVGDAKSRPVLVIAPDAATRVSARLLPTTVSRELLSGPLGHVSVNDLETLEPWEP